MTPDYTAGTNLGWLLTAAWVVTCVLFVGGAWLRAKVAERKQEQWGDVIPLERRAR